MSLVLTRKVGQTIDIGEDIVITVIEVRGDKIRIAVEAPRDVRVNRGEITARIAARIAAAAENMEANVSTDSHRVGRELAAV